MAKENYNFPIKFIPKEISIARGVGVLIALKCYLIEDKVHYFSDGTSKRVYVIVPFYSNSLNRIYPEIILSGCYNSLETDVLFDTLEDCQRYTKTKNNELYSKDMKDILHKAYSIESELLKDKQSNIIDFSIEKSKVRRKRF